MKTVYGVVSGAKVYHLAASYDDHPFWFTACNSNTVSGRPMKRGAPPKEWMCKTCLKKLESLKKKGQEIEWYGDKPEWA